MSPNFLTRVAIPTLILVALCVRPTVAADRPVLEITADTILDPDTTYGAIVIRTGGVTIDGRGAILLGSLGGDPSGFTGTGIRADGVSGVTLKNVRAQGWERGLHVSDAEGWTIDGCDFSDNFHDPRFGWGENGRRGGMLLERVSASRISGNRAFRVWDGCVLVESDDNTLTGNDFSHASNTCLKLWTSCRNTVRGNRLTHGIRIDPGEVHARDSTCVLLESGSNDNRFLDNDCTHGGDGIFIRVLNGWVSTGNLFEGNDCSHANNNCIEAWAPRNRWIRNKANGGSYGFWLGASDQNVLVENEACDNGRPDGPHNSPHLPDSGHAGIVFMFGPSSHTVLRGNVCRGNNGAGIAAIGDLPSKGRAWRAFHWVAEDNFLENNRWGFYLQHADMLDFAANRFTGNTAADLFDAGNVTGLVEHAPVTSAAAPRAVLEGPAVVGVGEPARFSAASSLAPDDRTRTFRWQIDSERYPDGPEIEVRFAGPGFHRVALTVTAGGRSDLAWRDLIVVDSSPESGTEWGAEFAQPTGWRSEDGASQVSFSIDRITKLVGAASLSARVDPYGGGRVTLFADLDGPPRRLPPGGSVVAWIRARNPHVPAWQDGNPVISLRDAGGGTMRLTPSVDRLATPADTETREGWLRVEAPLAGGDGWILSGDRLDAVSSIGLGFDSWGAPPLDIWIDGLHLSGESAPE